MSSLPTCVYFFYSPKSEFCPFSAIFHSAGLKLLSSVFRHRRFPGFKWGRAKSELRIGLANHSADLFLDAAASRPKDRPKQATKTQVPTPAPRNIAPIRNQISSSAFLPRVYGETRAFVPPFPPASIFFIPPSPIFCSFSAILHSAGLKLLRSVFRPRRFPWFKWGRAKSEFLTGLANHIAEFSLVAAASRPKDHTKQDTKTLVLDPSTPKYFSGSKSVFSIGILAPRLW